MAVHLQKIKGFKIPEEGAGGVTNWNTVGPGVNTCCVPVLYSHLMPQ